MASEALTSAGYIKHHLTYWTFGKLPDGHWGFAHDAKEAAEGDEDGDVLRHH